MGEPAQHYEISSARFVERTALRACEQTLSRLTNAQIGTLIRKP